VDLRAALEEMPVGKRKHAEAQYIRQVLRLLTLQAEPSVTPSRPNAIPGNASDSRATINKAMSDPRLARANIDIAVARVAAKAATTSGDAARR